MLWITRNPNNSRITSTSQALKTVYEKMVIDSRSIPLIKSPPISDLDASFLTRYNKGDSIYRAGEPFASLVGGDHKLMQRSMGGQWKDHELWPDVFTESNYYLKPVDSDKSINVQSSFGPFARTKITGVDVDAWILFWSVVDLIEGVGAYVNNIDDRIPGREAFLTPYKVTSWTDNIVSSFSQEELDLEIRSSLAPHYGATNSLRGVVEPWLCCHPDALYSLHFEGRYLTITRHPDLSLVAYYAEKENHPFLRRFK